MIAQAQAKIFLSDAHGLTETATFRNRQLFNYGAVQNEYRSALSEFYLLNDYTLAGGCSVTVEVEANSFVVLLPVVGAVEYKNGSGNGKPVTAGQTLMLEKSVATSFSLTNMFADELVNVLVLAFKKKEDYQLPSGFVYDYDVNERPNGLVHTLTGRYELPVQLFAGKFNGRGETIYKATNSNSRLFVFVLEGAFEVEGRLLHARDGLALEGIDAIEMEALSNDALVLVMELDANH
jgi:quercetin 2,3-dioxygenase